MNFFWQGGCGVVKNLYKNSSVDPDLTSHFFSLLVLYHIFPNYRLDPGSGS